MENDGVDRRPSGIATRSATRNWQASGTQTSLPAFRVTVFRLAFSRLFSSAKFHGHERAESQRDAQPWRDSLGDVWRGDDGMGDREATSGRRHRNQRRQKQTRRIVG